MSFFQKLTKALLQKDRYTPAFKPHDSRLLLGIYIGCIMVHQLRITTKEQKKHAARFGSYLCEQIDHLKKLLLEELKASILDVREGKLQLVEE